MELISPTDSLFLLAESREHPMHVGGLQLFEPPPRQAPISFAISTKACSPMTTSSPRSQTAGRAVRRNCQRRMVVRPRHRSGVPPPPIRPALTRPRPGTSRTHVPLARRPARPAPPAVGDPSDRGTQRRPVRRLHQGSPCPRRWRDRDEADERALSPDAADHDIRVPGPPSRGRRGREVPASRLSELGSLLGSVAALGPSMLTVAPRSSFEQQLTLPFGAPKTMFNVPIGGARRTAAQSWPIKRFLAIKGPPASPLTTWCSPCARARFARI